MAIANAIVLAEEKIGQAPAHPDGRALAVFLCQAVLQKYAARTRRRLAKEHQWLVSIPGAVEAMAHWRGNIEELAICGAIEPVVAADIDLVNMFGNCQWVEVRQAIDETMVEIVAWTGGNTKSRM